MIDQAALAQHPTPWTTRYREFHNGWCTVFEYQILDRRNKVVATVYDEAVARNIVETMNAVAAMRERKWDLDFWPANDTWFVVKENETVDDSVDHADPVDALNAAAAWLAANEAKGA